MEVTEIVRTKIWSYNQGELGFASFTISCIFEEYWRWKDIVAYTWLALYDWMRRESFYVTRTSCIWVR